MPRGLPFGPLPRPRAVAAADGANPTARRGRAGRREDAARAQRVGGVFAERGVEQLAAGAAHEQDGNRGHRGVPGDESRGPEALRLGSGAALATRESVGRGSRQGRRRSLPFAADRRGASKGCVEGSLVRAIIARGLSGQATSLAEREGFEPPVPLRVHLISSQAHSTRLCHLSAEPGKLASRCDPSPLRSSPRAARRSCLPRRRAEC